MRNIDDIRTEIMARIEAAESDLARIEIHKADAVATLQARRAELAGFERGVRAMQAAQTEPPAAPAKRQRHDIRGAVRARLEQLGEGVAIDEGLIAAALEQQGISAAGLHSYLLRGAKAGEVERDGSRYRLPQKSVPDEFSLAAPKRDAAE